MSRLHIFEWEDQPWFPEIFRNFITDHLVFLVSRAFAPAMPKLAEAMKSSGHNTIVDLCSGGGGPLPALLPELSDELGESVNATLTDLYPNIEAFEEAKAKSDGDIDYRKESTSAIDCPESLEGFRTIFTALHHFRPEGAKKILADAVDKQVPIAAFEAQERSFAQLIVIPFVIFVSAFIMTPFVGRLSVGRVFFTYIIPLAPLFFTWDAVVSCLRTYDPDELKELTEELHKNSYRWEIGQISAFGYIVPYRITYLVGMPGNEAEQNAT
jgi:hypothetical protein